MAGRVGADSRVRANQDTLEAKEEASQKALFATPEAWQDAIEVLSPQQHELTGRFNEIAGLLPGTASVLASLRAAREPSGTDETHPLLFKRPHPT